MASQKLILVTNDDGIFAPGIKALVQVAAAFGRVVVVAPDKAQSAQGHAITINFPLRLRKVKFMDDIEAYECSGTPVDCVKLAKNVLLKDQKIDLCVSGINHGSNASINIIYSGTMSAAMEASIEGIDSIGFSLDDFSFDADFSAAKHYATIIMQKVLQRPLEGCKLLNVNFPKAGIEAINGIKICKQGEGNWVEDFQIGTDPRGQKYYWLTGNFKDMDDDLNTDLQALRHGFISIVPSGHDLTVYRAMETLETYNF